MHNLVFLVSDITSSFMMWLWTFVHSRYDNLSSFVIAAVQVLHVSFVNDRQCHWSTVFIPWLLGKMNVHLRYRAQGKQWGRKFWVTFILAWLDSVVAGPGILNSSLARATVTVGVSFCHKRCMGSHETVREQETERARESDGVNNRETWYPKGITQKKGWWVEREIEIQKCAEVGGIGQAEKRVIQVEPLNHWSWDQRREWH